VITTRIPRAELRDAFAEPRPVRLWRGLRYVALVLAWALSAFVVLHR
jgi:hypothetical protein